jgi:DNA-binding CsgD family transcriptional regulator
VPLWKVIRKRKPLVESPYCQLYLFQAGGPFNRSISVDLVEKQLEVGRSVEGPGKLEFQGVAPLHAKLWRDKSGNWLRPINGHAIWLNSVPVSTRARTKLIKGDSLVFGESSKGPEFWVLCRRAKEADEILPLSQSTEQAEEGNRTSRRGIKGLSRAEYDVMAWMARGVVEVEDISRQLFRSVNTVRTQLSKIYEKIGVHSRAELLGVLIRTGNSLERQKKDVSKLLGVCPCSHGFATRNSAAFFRSENEPAVSS